MLRSTKDLVGLKQWTLGTKPTIAIPCCHHIMQCNNIKGYLSFFRLFVSQLLVWFLDYCVDIPIIQYIHYIAIICGHYVAIIHLWYGYSIAITHPLIATNSYYSIASRCFQQRIPDMPIIHRTSTSIRTDEWALAADLVLAPSARGGILRGPESHPTNSTSDGIHYPWEEKTEKFPEK